MKKTKELPVYLTVYASFFDTHAQLPIVALFARSLGADPFGIGMVIGMYSLCNIVGNGIGGRAIDRWGWRKALLAGMVAVGVILYGYLWVGTAASLTLLRGLHGLAGGILIPATLASLSPEAGEHFAARHGRNVSNYGISIGLAALTGPLFAGFISSRYSFQQAYLGIALLMTAAALFAFAFTRQKVSAPREPLDWASPAGFKLSTLTAAACMLAFALMGGTGTLAAFMPVLAETHGFTQGGIGILFGLFALTIIVLQVSRAVVPWGRFDLFKTAIGGGVVLAAALLMIHIAHKAPVFGGGVILYGVGFGTLFPTLLVMIMKGVSLRFKGITMGIFFAFYSLGAAVVAPLSGWIWQRLPAVTPPVTAAVVILLCIAGVNRIRIKAAAEDGNS